MAEPSSTAGAVAVATGVITITGSIVGLQYDALLFGLLGGLISLMHVSVGSPVRMAGTLATAAILGAISSQFSPALIANIPGLPLVKPDHVRLAAALLVGLFGQFTIPLLMNWMKSKSEGRA